MAVVGAGKRAKSTPGTGKDPPGTGKDAWDAPAP
eukprot:CAMPEP_0180664068 /NCGR_PEP_ID=MMETSP1037_2-20121125/60387_1 /TAXON_ID=632150 /ORGANISM="Azadinium spinosum, Strain 3D9" /LENGTH=33 /DNA_ID= /DNA_START= /DNA_END= /DNA_ORIENTATION=